MAHKSALRIIVHKSHSKQWKDEMICTQQRHDWQVSSAHWKNIKLTLGIWKEKRIRYGIQNLTKYEHVQCHVTIL